MIHVTQRSILANGHYWWLIQTSFKIKKRYPIHDLKMEFSTFYPAVHSFQKRNQHPCLFHGLRLLWHHFSTPSPFPPYLLWQPKFIGFSIVNLWKQFETPKNFNQKYWNPTIVRILQLEISCWKGEKNNGWKHKAYSKPTFPPSNSTTQVTSDKNKLVILDTQLLY